MALAIARKRIAVAVSVAAVLVAIAVYFYFDPNDSVIFPRCPFLMVTGLQCPGCGSQRAVHALLHGDIASAWGYNAILVAFIPVIVVLLLAEFLRGRHPRFHAVVNSTTVTWGCFAILGAWWLLRNFLEV